MKKLVIIGSVLIVSILLFKIFLWKGYLQIEGVAPPFTADFKGYARLSCETKPCLFTLPLGAFEINIKKEGYFDYEFNKYISLQKTFKQEVKLRKIPVLTELKEIPEVFKKDFHTFPAISEEDSYAFREDGELFYLEHKTGNFYMGQGEKRQLLAKFTTIKQAYISPTENSVFLLSEGKLFEVSIEKKQKFRLLADREILYIKTSEKGLIVKTSNTVLVRREKEFIALPFYTEPDLVCLNKSIFMFYDGAIYSLDSNRKKIIDLKNSEKIKKISCEKDDEIFILLGDIAYSLSL